MSTNPKSLLAEQEYLAIERKASYRSEMFAMARATREHSMIKGNVFLSLREQLDERPCEIYSTNVRVRVNPTGLCTYPDVIVACNGPRFANGEFDVLLNPTVLVEVLSPLAASYDRGDKLMHYRRLESLQELLLIEQEYPAVDHYIRQPNGDWLLKQPEGMDAVVELPSIRCRLTFADIYARITFPPDARRPLRPMREQ